MTSLIGNRETLASRVDAFLADNTSMDPHALFREVRESEPVFRTQHGFLITRYIDAQALFRDERFVRHEQAQREYAAMGAAGEEMASLFSNLDGHDHRRIRMLVNKAFVPAVVRHWRPLIAANVAKLMDDLEVREEFDLLGELGEPVAETAVCQIMGVPLENYHECTHWGKIFIDQNRVAGDSAELQGRAIEAVAAANAYFRAFIDEKARNLDDDFVSALINAKEGDDRLSTDELIKVLRFLILGGTDNTANQLANGMWHLLNNPDQWALLKSNPDLLESAVEECLRYETSGRSNPRMAVEDVELSGVIIPKGSTAFTFVSAGNRDPELFPDPDRFDITRSKSSKHIAFAYGPHVCVGSHLARIILQEAISALMTRTPDIVPAIAAPEWRKTWIRSMRRFPVHRRGSTPA